MHDIAIPAEETRFLDFLGSLGIASTTRRHPPVFTVEEAKAHRGEIPGGHCKNLFLKDKKDRLWLVVALEDVRVDLKALEKRLGAARLSFGKPDLLQAVLGVEPGSVTPFALMNDRAGKVGVILHERMLRSDPLNYHPLHNAATTSISPADLRRFIAATGHEMEIVDLDNL